MDPTQEAPPPQDVKDPNETYFAAKPPEEIGRALFRKVEESGKGTLPTQMAEIHTRARQYFYGMDVSGAHATSRVLRGGEQGELAQLRVNHCRSLVNTLVNLVTAAKVTWEPKATNTDLASVAECHLAASVLEYYWDTRSVVAYAIKALRQAVVYGDSFLVVDWNSTAGEDVMPDETGRMMKSGDVRFANVLTWDVIRDSTAPSFEESNWAIVRMWKNKYDLAAEFPNSAEDVVGAQADLTPSTFRSPNEAQTDNVAVYYFFHRRTAALPNGRQVVFLDAEKVLDVKEELPYDSFPVLRIATEDIEGSPYGYTPFFEIMGIQEVIDSLHTSITSNQTTFGTQNILLPWGSEIDQNQLSGGLRAIYVKQGEMEPKALQLTATPPEIFTHLEGLKKDQRTLFGINDVVQGQTPTKDMSGAALALLQSQALQQSSTLQTNYLQLITSIGQTLLEMLKRYAAEPRLISIAGKSDGYLVKQAKVDKNSFGRVSRVTIDIGNPMSQTAAGRQQIAEMYLKMGAVHSPEQLEEVIATGRMKPLTKALRNELVLIVGENEAIRDGQPPPPPMIHDDHVLHCREHKGEVSSLEARGNPALLNAAIEHIHAHYSLYYTVQDPLTDPMYRDRMLVLMGLKPPALGAPPMPPPGMGPPPPNGPPGPPPGPGPGHPPGPVPVHNFGPPGHPPGPPGPAPAGTPSRMPSMPTNPSTGQKWDPSTGGGMVAPPTAK